MRHTGIKKCLLMLWMVLFIAVFSLPAQSKTAPKAKTPTALEEARSFRDAMELFKKAEAMIGTPDENSEAQADLFRQVIKLKPDFLEAHYNLGLIYANQRKMKEAIEEIETVLKLEPKFDPDIYYILATAYQESGNPASAIKALEEGLRRKSDDLKFLKALAYLQFDEKVDAAAIENLQKILALDPQDTTAHIDLALLFQRNGQTDKAAEHFKAASISDPQNFSIHYNLALIYMRQKKNAEAAVELEAANKIQPGNADLLEKLGDAYAFQQQHPKAVNAYRAALEKVKNRSSIYAKLGFSLANLNRNEEAVAALENAVRLDAKNPEVYFLLGDLYEDLKRLDDAIGAYKHSLEINPSQKTVHYNLGTLYAGQNLLKEAMDEFKKAIQLDPNYAAAWSNVGLVAEKLELDKEAIEAHEKVLTLGKGQAVNYFHLGILYAKSNQPDPSIAAFTRAIEMEPEKYRAVLKEELKKVHSVLDPIRYKEGFTKLLGTAPTR
jgi:tetratricopeptide (TPR) repeat protein